MSLFRPGDDLMEKARKLREAQRRSEQRALEARKRKIGRPYRATKTASKSRLSRPAPDNRSPYRRSRADSDWNGRKDPKIRGSDPHPRRLNQPIRVTGLDWALGWRRIYGAVDEQPGPVTYGNSGPYTVRFEYFGASHSFSSRATINRSADFANTAFDDYEGDLIMPVYKDKLLILILGYGINGGSEFYKTSTHEISAQVPKGAVEEGTADPWMVTGWTITSYDNSTNLHTATRWRGIYRQAVLIDSAQARLVPVTPGLVDHIKWIATHYQNAFYASLGVPVPGSSELYLSSAQFYSYLAYPQEDNQNEPLGRNPATGATPVILRKDVVQSLTSAAQAAAAPGSQLDWIPLLQSKQLFPTWAPYFQKPNQYKAIVQSGQYINQIVSGAPTHVLRPRPIPATVDGDYYPMTAFDFGEDWRPFYASLGMNL